MGQGSSTPATAAAANNDNERPRPHSSASHNHGGQTSLKRRSFSMSRKKKGPSDRHPDPISAGTVDDHDHTNDEKEEIGYSPSGLSQRRPSDLIVREVSEGEPAELEGLQISVGEGKRLSLAKMKQASMRSMEVLNEQYRLSGLGRSETPTHWQCLASVEQSVPPHRTSPERSKTPDTKTTAPYLAVLPLRMPTPQSSGTPPASRWSPSTAGDSSPAVNPFRNSFINSFTPSATNSNPKRSSQQRFSSQTLAAQMPRTASPKGFNMGSFRIGQKEKQSKIRKRTITIVGAQRVASGRYSIMRETAARAAAARKESIVSMGGSSSRRGSLASGPAGERRGSLTPAGPGGRRRSSAQSTTYAGERRRSSGASAGSSSRSAARKGSASAPPPPIFEATQFISPFGGGALISPPDSLKRANPANADGNDGPWVDLDTPPPSPPKGESRHNRSPSQDALLSFVAASPHLTFAAPSDPDNHIFEPYGRKLSYVPVPSMVRLPKGHPANHHDRFKAFQAKAAEVDGTVGLPPPLQSASWHHRSGPAVPPRPLHRRASSSAISSKIDQASLRNCSPSGSRDLAERRPSQSSTASNLRNGPVARKLSNFRLSIADPRADLLSPEGRPVSEAPSVGETLEYGAVHRQSMGNDSAASQQGIAVSIGEDSLRSSTYDFLNHDIAPQQPTPSHLRHISSNSFPRSVSYASSPDSPGVNHTDSILSAYFGEEDVIVPEPAPPTLPKKSSYDSFASSDEQTPKASGAINWDAYSLMPRPVSTSSSHRTGTGHSFYSDIAPEALEAFPAPPPEVPRLRWRDNPPAPVQTNAPPRRPSAGPYSSPASSPASIPRSVAKSTKSSITSSSSSVPTDDAKLRLVVGRGARFSVTHDGAMERLSNVVQIDLADVEGSTYRRFESMSSGVDALKDKERGASLGDLSLSKLSQGGTDVKGCARLGPAKRGLNKGEIKDWLQEARREPYFVPGAAL